MIRYLLGKIFKKNVDFMLYTIPFLNIFLCFTLFDFHVYNDSSKIITILACTSLFALIGIAVNLRRFIKTLQRPYQKSNLYMALSCIFTTITFFASLYTIIYIALPNSFAGFNETTQLNKCIDMLYFSIITFTTLGYGDIYPVHSIAKIFVSIETMSFFIFFGILASNHTIFIKPKENSL